MEYSLHSLLSFCTLFIVFGKTGFGKLPRPHQSVSYTYMYRKLHCFHVGKKTMQSRYNDIVLHITSCSFCWLVVTLQSGIYQLESNVLFLYRILIVYLIKVRLVVHYFTVREVSQTKTPVNHSNICNLLSGKQYFYTGKPTFLDASIGMLEKYIARAIILFYLQVYNIFYHFLK